MGGRARSEGSGPEDDDEDEGLLRCWLARVYTSPVRPSPIYFPRDPKSVALPGGGSRDGGRAGAEGRILLQ